MKTAALKDIQRIEIRSVPKPDVIRPNDVLIKMNAVGICGSDIHYFTQGRIGDQVINFPFTIGHEGAGTVEKVGNDVTRVQSGDRVAIDPAISCGRCDQCLAGRRNTCRDLTFLGCPGQREGCLCEYIVLPDNCCFPISDTMSFEQALLSEPLSIALYAVEQAPVLRGGKAAVLGAGPIGMSVLGALQLKNAGAIYVTDVLEERAAFAQRFGAAWSGNPLKTDVVRDIAHREPLLLDAVYDCCGKPEALLQAVELLKPGGTLAVIGIPETDMVPFPAHSLRRKEITVKNIRRQNGCTGQALSLIGGPLKNLGRLITHRFPLEQTQEAFDLAANYRDGIMKAVITLC
ncbi:MAG: alcohol dehydrogenase catalytic domain-containing protein [Chitinispirillaceae bacterium]|nr:alcohol dehydrogenase catalytic domain-containing protein [Chitinispirillaceae bacterium]